MEVVGKLVDIHKKEIYPAKIIIENKRIKEILKIKIDTKNYILPGIIDSHIHIESSMVTPGSFAKAAVSRGTTGVIADPHEIANVLGIKGVEFMINDAKKVPLKFWFGAPSCVPATDSETSGAEINSEGIRELLKRKEIKFMAEMMNYPGVVYNNSEVYRKLEIAKEYKKPVDGHAPGLTGENLKKYISAGISTDHECSTIDEAKEKISLGMKILIREGSAAKNLNSLKDLVRTDPEMIMLCSDDLHPEMLAKRHLDKIIAELFKEGYNLFDIIRSCTINPVLHYNLDAGLLKSGDRADFIIVEDFITMKVLETWIDGTKVYDRGRTLFTYEKSENLNNFNCSEISIKDIRVKRQSGKIRVIKAFDGELLTKEEIFETKEGKVVIDADPGSDLLKIVVKDRYNDKPPATGFLSGFGLKKGAFASSVAHDSHNIICAGTNDEDIISAINEIVKIKGGLTVVCKDKKSSLQLPVAGIMSDRPLSDIAGQYEMLSDGAKSLGCKLSAPFMTLSFMALLVIPELKISDRGLFDGRSFKPISLFAE